jgi:integrase
VGANPRRTEHWIDVGVDDGAGRVGLVEVKGNWPGKEALDTTRLQLERLRDSGTVPAAGRKWTVGEWLEHWLESMAKPSLRESSFDAYRYAVRGHLIPGVGRHRLDRLQPEHLERLYRSMIELGARPGTAHQVHRTVRTAMGETHRRGHVVRNVAALAKPPKVQHEPVEPLSLDEVHVLLRQASQMRNGARWAAALALGLRQGEVLGLRWSDVDFDTASLRVRGTLVRPVYGHGCGGDCGRKPGFCPQRRRANAVRGATKSAAGQRVIGFPTSSWRC